MTDLVVQHHQGAGVPSDAALDAIAESGYGYGIGATRWRFYRPPADDYSTAGYNGRCIGVCLTGDRNVYQVTAGDITMMQEIAAHARGNGFLVDAPYVQPHREMPPPNATICPGNNVAYVHPPKFPYGDDLTWVGIVSAYHKETAPMPPTVSPEFFPSVPMVSMCGFVKGYVITATSGETYKYPAKKAGTAVLDASGAVFCEPADSYAGGANGQGYFKGRTAATITPM